jgi:hypothetical protein
MDQAILEGVNVLHHLVEDDRSAQIPNRLVDVYDGSAACVGAEGYGLYVGIDLGPLAGPVLAYAAVAVYPATLHSVGPIDITVHGLQGGIDVARVERSVRGKEQIASR